jgi:hypothetical protein
MELYFIALNVSNFFFQHMAPVLFQTLKSHLYSTDVG